MLVSPSSPRESSWRWVADGVDALAAAQDANTVLAALARVTVAHLADCSIVFAKRESGGLELATSRHRDPTRDALAREFARRYPVSEDAGAGAVFVARTGQSELLPIVPVADSVARAGDSGQHPLDVLRAFAMHSAMAVPLKAGAETIGAIVLTRSESQLPFNVDDLAVAETLARIGAWSIVQLHQTQETRQPHGVSGSARMLSVASHEVMNCLGVLGMSAAILLRTGELDPAIRAKHLNVIDRDTKHVARLSRDLVDIARLHAGPLALNREPRSATALMREAADSVASARVIVVEDDGAELNVEGDHERILQVLSTLLTYATAHASAPYSITVSAVASADQVRIMVADEDSQMSDAMLSLLSDPLHGIGRTDSRELGLQMFICQEIITAHGGRLWIERFEVRGYKFCFTLPLAA